MSIIKSTAQISFFLQILTYIATMYVFFFMYTPALLYVFQLLKIEIAVNTIEGIFYYWMINSFSKISNITAYRYYDWAISTPLMLFVLMAYIRLKDEKNKIDNMEELLKKDGFVILSVLLLNWFMLLTGYLNEIKLMNKYMSTIIGFVPFALMFWIIYDYFDVNTMKSGVYYGFIYFVIVWAIYGLAAIMGYNMKNVMYNILDLFAKNVTSIFIILVIISMYKKEEEKI